MYAVSDAFAEALRHSHTVSVRVDAYAGAQCVAADLPISGGSVEVSSSSGVRRRLSCTIADTSLWDQLIPMGIELHAYRGIRFPDGAEEMVPLGVFSLDQQSVPVRSGGVLAINSAPDRYARVQRARFEVPRASDTGLTNVDQIIRLVGEAVPVVADTSGVSLLNALSTKTVDTPVVWERDRDKAITDLATAAGLEVFFGPTGKLVLRDVTTMGSHPVWRVDAGRNGVMLSGTATRDRSRVFNVVVVSSTKTDGEVPFPPQVVADEDPTSPTNVNSPYGRVPYFLSTALIGDATDAYNAGKALLAKTRGRYIDMQVSAIVNPALEGGDTIAVATPAGTALYLVDSFSVPLSTEAAQSITLRSLAAVSGDSQTISNPATEPTTSTA